MDIENDIECSFSTVIVTSMVNSLNVLRPQVVAWVTRKSGLAYKANVISNMLPEPHTEAYYLTVVLLADCIRIKAVYNEPHRGFH